MTIFNSETRETNIELPVEVTVEWVADDAPEISWLGGFTLDRPYSGAIRVELPWDVRRTLFRRGADGEHPHYAYFENPEGLGNIEDNRQERLGRHASWVKARSACKQDAERLLAYYNDEWSLVGIGVTVRCFGLVGSSRLFGIEHGHFTNAEEKFHEEIIQEQIEEALDDLRKKIGRVREAFVAIVGGT